MSDPYDVSSLLPGGELEELPAGTNIAIMGPAMTGKRKLALQLLAARLESNEGILCITTVNPEKIYEDLKRHLEAFDKNRVGIINASGSHDRELLDASVESVSSPSDLTGISIGIAKLSQLFERRGLSDIRHGLISISAMLQYLDTQTVFRFLHIYTKRIDGTGGLGIYTLDSESHSPQIVNTIIGQFDGVVELRENDESNLEYRVRGLGHRPTPWNPFNV